MSRDLSRCGAEAGRREAVVASPVLSISGDAHPGSSVRLLCPAHETPGLIRGLAERLGPRFEQKAGIKFPASPMRFGVVLLIVALLLALYLFARSETGPYSLGLPVFQTIAKALPWVFLTIVPLWMLIEILDVIPRGDVEKQKKVSWGRDQSWRRPFHSRIAGATFRIVGTLVLLGWSGMVSLSLYGRAPDWFTQGESLNFAWLVLGSSLVYLGHAAGSKSATEDRASDGRPHTLYLRSFLDDDANNLNPRTRLAAACGLITPWPFVLLPFPLRHIFNLHPLRLFRAALGSQNDSSEQQLGKYFHEFGPFIAIGKPGERFSPLGASREYVNQDHWKEVVSGYIDGARYVVLQPAKTEGIWWEVKTVFSRVPRQRILLCLSNYRGRQDDYDDFRVRLKQETGVDLPRSIGNRNEILFAFFDAAGNPQVHTLSSLSPLLWPLLGQVADLRRTLVDFVDPAHRSVSPYLKKTYEGHALPASVFATIVIPLVLVAFASLGAFLILFLMQHGPWPNLKGQDHLEAQLEPAAVSWIEHPRPITAQPVGSTSSVAELEPEATNPAPRAVDDLPKPPAPVSVAPNFVEGQAHDTEVAQKTAEPLTVATVSRRRDGEPRRDRRATGRPRSGVREDCHAGLNPVGQGRGRDEALDEGGQHEEHDRGTQRWQRPGCLAPQ